MSADLIDDANDRAAIYVSDAERDAHRAVAAMPAGEAGECDWCGNYVERLVGGACGRCRDRRKLP